jgi:hypothetical protein
VSCMDMVETWLALERGHAPPKKRARRERRVVHSPFVGRPILPQEPNPGHVAGIILAITKEKQRWQELTRWRD